MITEQQVRDVVGDAYRAGLITLGAADYILTNLEVKP